MISFSGQFNYHVLLTKAGPGIWRGRATPWAAESPDVGLLRDGTGAAGAILSRGSELQAGLGAIESDLGQWSRIDHDPRAEEERFSERPRDLWLRIAIGGFSTVVKEGEYAFIEPWHLTVRKVYEPGDPGESSQLAVVRHDPAITKESVIESAELMAAGGMELRD